MATEERHSQVRIAPFPYTIAYRITDTEVVVLAVAHHRIDPAVWEGR